MSAQLKPLLFGYLRLRITARRGAEVRARRALKAFADREGYALVDVYVDADENRPCWALAAMIRCISGCEVDSQMIAVAVPDLGHLGLSGATQQQMRARIQREAHVRVITVQSAR